MYDYRKCLQYLTLNTDEKYLVTALLIIRLDGTVAVAAAIVVVVVAKAMGITRQIYRIMGMVGKE